MPTGSHYATTTKVLCSTTLSGRRQLQNPCTYVLYLVSVIFFTEDAQIASDHALKSIAASLHGHAPSLPHSTIFPRLILSIQEGRRWQMVCQGPRPGFVLCSRDGKICCYGDALSTIFLLTWYLILCLDSYFSFFFSFPFLFLSASCPFVCAAATCYSQQVRILFMIRVLSACVICTLPRLGFLHRFLP